MDCEFDEHCPFGNVKHLAADVDDAPTEFEALIEGTATTDQREFTAPTPAAAMPIPTNAATDNASPNSTKANSAVTPGVR
jgi:hypothetical protein